MNKRLVELAKLACQRAQKQGAKEAAARVGTTRHFKVVIRDGKQEELRASESRSLSLRVFVDGRYGQHTTNALQPDELERFVDDAVDMTRYLMQDAYRSLPSPDLYLERSTGDLEIFDPSQTEQTMDRRKEVALQIHDIARSAAGDKVISVGAGCTDRLNEMVLFHTNGFVDGERSTTFGAYASVSVKDPSGKRPSDWAQTAARKQAQLDPPEKVGQLAAERALACIGADTIPSCRLPLIIENRAVGRLLSGLLGPLSGRALDQRRSCFEGRLGKRVAAPLLTIMDEPLLPQGWGSRRFDWEGLTAKKMPLLEKGVLKNFYIDTYYGKKLKQSPTTNSGSNLIFSTGSKGVDALCAAAEKAILISRFIGGNSNGTTGDFSHGITGFLIERGKRTKPLAAMNVAGNHLEFWKGLIELGNDPYPYSNNRTPSMLFTPVLVAGK